MAHHGERHHYKPPVYHEVPVVHVNSPHMMHHKLSKCGRAIHVKMKEEASHILTSQIFKIGFKEGKSHAKHSSRLL
jgi:hypothetical protein